MRALLCGTLVECAFTSKVFADDNKAETIDAKKLVGEWKPKVAAEGARVVIEFAKENKFTVIVGDVKSKHSRFEGEYEIDGSRLVLKTYGWDAYTVTKLTDTELVLKDEKGVGHPFLRLNGK